MSRREIGSSRAAADTKRLAAVVHEELAAARKFGGRWTVAGCRTGRGSTTEEECEYYDCNGTNHCHGCLLALDQHRRFVCIVTNMIF